jgi:hypothetical protein
MVAQQKDVKMVLNWMVWERVVIEVVIGSWMETGS